MSFSQTVVYFCDSARVRNLATFKTNVNWYDSLESSATLLNDTVKLMNKLYFFDSTINLTTKTPKDSIRVVIVQTLDTSDFRSFSRERYFCYMITNMNTIGDLIRDNNNDKNNSGLIYFRSADTTTDKVNLSNETILMDSTTYYATIRSNPNTLMCQSPRVGVKVFINPLPIIEEVRPNYFKDTIYFVGASPQTLSISVKNTTPSTQISWYINRGSNLFDGLPVKPMTKDSFLLPYTSPDSFLLYENFYEFYYAVANTINCVTTSKFSGQIVVNYDPKFTQQTPSNDTANICLGSDNSDTITYSFQASPTNQVGKIKRFELYRTSSNNKTNGVLVLRLDSPLIYSYDTTIIYKIPTDGQFTNQRYYAIIFTNLNKTDTSNLSGIKSIRPVPSLKIEALSPNFIHPELNIVRLVRGDVLKLKAVLAPPFKAKDYRRLDTTSHFVWENNEQVTSYYDSLYISQPRIDYSTIKLTASNGYGCRNEAQIIVWVKNNDKNRAAIFNIPKLLTPNEDNINDTWTFDLPKISALNSVSKINITIYNTQNKVVFDKTYGINEYMVFDAKDNKGEALPTGTYYFVIKIDEIDYIQTGYFMVVQPTTGTN